MMLYYGLHQDKELGQVVVAWQGQSLYALNFGDEAGLKRRFPHGFILKHDPDQAQSVAMKALKAWSSGNSQSQTLELQGTLFQKKAWQALLDIPYGQTKSYGEIAQAIGNPRAAQAVGQAVGANPVALLVPCHRIIRGDGALGGYAWGAEKKRQILAREGIFLT